MAAYVFFDPKADLDEWPGERKFTVAESAEELVLKSDILLLLTEWPEFRRIPWKKLLNKKNPQTVFDAKNFLADLHLGRMGYRALQIGSGNHHAE